MWKCAFSSGVDDLLHMGRPQLQRLALLFGILMALINSHYASATSGRMIENRLCDLKADAELLQSRGAGPAQIVGPPTAG